MPATTPEILERLNAAAAQRGLAGPTLTAYRRIWRDTLIRAASAKLDYAALPQARAEEFYSELTRGRGPSCHLQAKAALALLYRVLEVPIPSRTVWSPNSGRKRSKSAIWREAGSPKSFWSCNGTAGIISTMWSAIWPRRSSAPHAGSMNGLCSRKTGWCMTGRGGSPPSGSK